MKKLTCEMCGSTDLIKQDGVFVCQACGCRYTVEDAKKMMVEGTVDVSGSTVKVDTSDELANLYQIARRARDDNNIENAAKYYEMILVKDPNSWEAAFYTVYFQTMSCKIGQIKNAAITLTNCEENVLKLVKATLPKENWYQIVTEIIMSCSLAANTLYNSAKSHYHEIDKSIRDKYHHEYFDNESAVANIVYNCGDMIETVFADYESIKELSAVAWKCGVAIDTDICGFCPSKARKFQEKIAKYDDAMKKMLDNEQEKTKINKEMREIEKQISEVEKEYLKAKTHVTACKQDKNSVLSNIKEYAIIILIPLIVIILCFATKSTIPCVLGIIVLIIWVYIWVMMIKGNREIKDEIRGKTPEELEKIATEIEKKKDELNNKKKELQSKLNELKQKM